MAEPKPHDALVKAVFSRPENAAGALRAVLPPALLAQLDLSALRSVPPATIDAELGERVSDLLFEVPLAGRPALVCMLVYEHQSSEDPLMPLRALRHAVRHWDRWLADHRDARRLPAIIPVVLYHGPRPWAAARSLRELIDLPEEGLVAAGAHLPALTFVLDDLTVTADASLRARETAAVGRLAFLLLKHARALVATPQGPGRSWSSCVQPPTSSGRSRLPLTTGGARCAISSRSSRARAPRSSGAPSTPRRSPSARRTS